MVFYHRWLVEQDGSGPETSTILKQIRDYNEEDCQSTTQLAEWLRQVQRDQGIEPLSIADSVDEPPQPAPETVRRRRALYARELLDQITEDRSDAPEHRRVHELLAHLLEFHRREEKPVWWRRFDWRAMEEQELIDDPACLGGLSRTDKPPYAVKRSTVFEYRFDPKQETKLREGDGCILTHDLDFNAFVLGLDLDDGLLDLKVGPSHPTPPGSIHLMPNELIVGEPLAASIEKLVRRCSCQPTVASGTGRLPVSSPAQAHRQPFRTDPAVGERLCGRRGGGSPVDVRHHTVCSRPSRNR